MAVDNVDRVKELEIVGRHESDAFTVFNEMREFDELCDITLNVNGKEIRAHRVVLAACSPYFRAMLTTGFLESNLNTISLQGCEESAVEKLIGFFYTCKLKLNETDVENALTVSSLFQIHLVSQECARFLETLIRVENCLGIQSLAMQYSLNNLQCKVKSFISWNFMQVSRENEFVLIPPEQLREIVQSDRLHVKMEEDVFEAVMRWYKYDRDKRLKCQDIMEMIRFPCMKTSYLENVALKDELVVSVPAWQRLVEDALHLLISAPQGKNKSRIKPRKSPNVLYLIGELSSRIEVFDLDAQCCRPVTNMAQTTGTAVVVNEELHVVLGGGTRIEKYDAKFNSWVQVGNGVKESDFAVCVSMGCIYVVGGGKRAKSFNLATRTWSTLPSMSMRRTFHSAVALQGKIYAVGGLGIPGYQAVASVECFNPASNRWEPVGRMITERHRHESAAMRNKIFVIGGIGCQNNTLTSAEVFDSATNTWSRIASLKYPRRDFGLGVLQDLLFVFGGNGTNTIECYDAIADKWNDVGSLAKRWNSFRCVLCPLYQV